MIFPFNRMSFAKVSEMALSRFESFDFSLAILISLAVHLFFITAALIPLNGYIALFPGSIPYSGQPPWAIQGDVIENMNEDEKAVLSPNTLLSDRDSSAHGAVTKKKGDTFLNNSLEFILGQLKSQNRNANGQSQTGSASSTASSATGLRSSAKPAQSVSADNENHSPYEITLIRTDSAAAGSSKSSEWTKIPDVKGMSRENALYMSNDGSFSFNTQKFKDAEYFRAMKRKISSNWFPPIMANGYAQQTYNERTGGFTPGYSRINAINSQQVKLYFSMDRAGNIREVVVLEHGGSLELVKSCVDSIRISKTFGKVPKDIQGEIVNIPFVFGYYVD